LGGSKRENQFDPTWRGGYLVVVNRHLNLLLNALRLSRAAVGF
jgi:hypothetical protein